MIFPSFDPVYLVDKMTVAVNHFTPKGAVAILTWTRRDLAILYNIWKISQLNNQLWVICKSSVKQPVFLKNIILLANIQLGPCLRMHEGKV